MKKIYIETIAPLLRGLTFDGEKGNIIIFEDDLNKISVAVKYENYNLIFSGGTIFDQAIFYNPFPLYLNLVQNSESLDKKQLRKKIISYTIEKFKDYKKKYNQDPSIIIVENTGIFYSGKSYDESINIKNNYEDILKKIKVKPKTIKTQGHIKEKKSKTNNVYKQDLESNLNTKKVDRNDIVRNKIAVVTGGAQGFGENIVRKLVESGCFVFIVDLNIKGACQVSEELNIKYKRTASIPIKVDVTDENSVSKMIYEIVKKAGGIDIFISNAGVLKPGSVKEMDFATFNFVTKVNYLGYFLCTKHASKIMSLQNMSSGKYFTDIIQINSKSGLKGSNKNSAYAGSKFGGLGLTQSFALELIEDNIKVNSICPGNFFEGPLWSDPENGLFVQYLRTGKVPRAKTIKDVKEFYELKVPMKRGCRGEDVIKAIYYIIDQKYETGQAIPVTGGQVMLN